MARKAKDETVLQIRASNDFVARLDDVAEAVGCTRSAFIRRACLEQFRRDAELIEA